MIRLRRALFVLAVLTATWAIVIALTGGFFVRFGWIRVSSRDPSSVAMVALVSWLAASMLRQEGCTDRSQPQPWWFDPAVTVALFGIILVFYQWISARPLWLDEEMVALNFRDRTLGALTGPLWLEQSAPFGWLALERVMSLMLGTSELALRFIPALFGVATVICAAWVGRRWMSPVGASALVLLCSFGQWLSFYSVELKPYSADTFWGLFLPALTMWAVSADAENLQKRRLAIWWTAAAIGQWISVGALLVTPGCVAVLLFVLFRRHGLRAVVRAVLYGAVWVLAFVLHYLLAVRYTLENPYLKEFWDSALPPASADLTGTLVWLAHQLKPFAIKPGGTGLWLIFWLSATLGFVINHRRTLSNLAAAVTVSAFVMTALRIVPLSERISLWILPALYLGIALFADSTLTLAQESSRALPRVRLVVAIMVGIVAFQLCSDVLRHGIDDVRSARPADSNRYLDDRSGVSWLLGQRQPGDVIMTTRFGLPAVWWYGRIPLPDAGIDGSWYGGAGSLLAVGHTLSDAECLANDLHGALKNRSRALVYLGFEDVPKGFDGLLLNRLKELGSITALRRFGSISRAAIVDFRVPSGSEKDATGDWESVPSVRVPPLTGCVTVREARRW